jgi:hypothetical protein
VASGRIGSQVIRSTSIGSPAAVECTCSKCYLAHSLRCNRPAVGLQINSFVDFPVPRARQAFSACHKPMASPSNGLDRARVSLTGTPSRFSTEYRVSKVVSPFPEGTRIEWRRVIDNFSEPRANRENIRRFQQEFARFDALSRPRLGVENCPPTRPWRAGHDVRSEWREAISLESGSRISRRLGSYTN